MPDLFSALRDMYQEHVAHARHHEVERERMTALIVAVATALIGVASHESLALRSLPLTLLLIPLGLFGRRFSAKHYERNRMHTTIAKHFRDAVDAELANPAVMVPPNVLGSIRVAGENDHNLNYAPGGRRRGARSAVTDWRLYTFWERLHSSIIIIGVIMSLCVLYIGRERIADYAKSFGL